MPSIAVIGEQSDTLCRSLARALSADGVPVLRSTPGELSSLKVSLGEEMMLVEGQVVAGVFFHCHPDRCFSDGYVAEDRAFCDAETRAIWLSALNLGAVLAINRYDATAWFEGLGWASWRRRLREAGIPVADIHVGGGRHSTGHWQLFASGHQRPLPRPEVQRCLAAAVTESEHSRSVVAVGGEILGGCSSPSAHAAAALLAEEGIWLAQLQLDQHGALLGVDPVPRVEDSASIQQITRRAQGAFHEHLDRWRYGRPDRGLHGLARAQARVVGAEAARRPVG